MTDELIAVPKKAWEDVLERLDKVEAALGEAAQLLGLGDEPRQAIDLGAGFEAFMARGREGRARRSA